MSPVDRLADRAPEPELDAAEAARVERLIEGDRVIYANQAMESLSGYTAVELSALPSWTALLEDAGAALLPSGAVSDLSPEPGAGRQEVMLRVRGGQRLA